MFSKIKLIAWDLDGTFFPPLPELKAEIDRIRVEAIAKHLGTSLAMAERRFNKLYQQLHSHTLTLDNLGLDGKQFFLNLWQTFDLSKYVEVNPKLAVLWNKTKTRGKQHALLTNANTKLTANKKLQAVGLSINSFDFVFPSGETGLHKPLPSAFAQLWEKTPYSKDKIVYIGDREKTDIVPAHNLGLKTVLVDWFEDSTQSIADLVVKSPIELLSLLLQE